MRTSSSAPRVRVTIFLCAVFATACVHKHKNAAVVVPSAPTPARVPDNTSSPQVPPKLAKSTAPLPVGYIEEGVASWYGIPYHGRKAADGEVYDMETLVAAHRLMPFNTWLKVTNLSNNKDVLVRIIDRGPFVDGRIIDLSKAAARQIDLIGPGVGRVRLEVVAAPKDIPADDFYAVQVGAFSMFENAERLRAGYEKRFGTARLVQTQGTIPLWRVLVGKEPTTDGAQRLATTLAAEKVDGFVVRIDEKIPAPAPVPPRNIVWQTPENVTFDPREQAKPPLAAPQPASQPAAPPQ